jgi:hypothetical protein
VERTNPLSLRPNNYGRVRSFAYVKIALLWNEEPADFAQTAFSELRTITSLGIRSVGSGSSA